MSHPMRVVRFAPSPTGHLHIGGVRTALFNYFYIKNQGGQYVLRIEDTDITRSSDEMAREIITGLHWLGIHWDSGPFYQSQRFDKYRQTANELLEAGKAYRCFCTPGEIEARRQASENKAKEEQIYKYDRQCLGLSPEQVREKLEGNVPFVLRFRVPEGMTFFKDRLHKEMKSSNTELEDFVILKSDNSPTYHLSVVVDDNEMGITDVIRGDDHISNTFKQVLLFKALDQKPPRYAHLPLILGPDKKKLSKRHGETSVLEFKAKGYLPEAIITYLAQLSWLPADSKNIFTMDQLVKQFSLSKVSKSSPVFDYDKLRFLNGKAIRQTDNARLLDLLEEDEVFARSYGDVDRQKKIALVGLVKPRMKTLPDFHEKFALYLSRGPLDYRNSDLEKLLEDFSAVDLKTNLQRLKDSLQKLEPGEFNHESLDRELRSCAEAHGVSAGDLIHPARFALTSETVSPSFFDVLAFFGKDEAMKRFTAFIEIP